MWSKKHDGFQIVEFCVVLTLISILILCGQNFNSSWISRWQMQQITNDLVHSLHQAKMLSTFENKFMLLEPLCSNDWSKGIQLKDSTGQVRRVWRWDNKHIKISWSGMSSMKSLVFSPSIHHSICNGHFDLLGYNKKIQIKINRIGSNVRIQL